MPRRGEYTRNFPLPGPRAAEPVRIGIRTVTGLTADGRQQSPSFDPAAFTCSHLAGELADEWVEKAASATLSATAAALYRQAITLFCRHVDAHVPHAVKASLGEPDPDLAHALTDWTRLLPASYGAGSRVPAALAGKLRILITRRAEHPDRPVAAGLRHWASGHVGLRGGQTQELDEFTRADKKELVKAAWSDHLAITARIRRGWELAATGKDPAEDGWDRLANLLWAITNDAWTCEEIAEHLPGWHEMPPSLREVMPPGTLPQFGKRMVLRHLVRQLFPHNLDLHSYRILLMAATGRSSEEVSALTEDDIEFGPRSVVIDFTKGRAHARTRQAFSTLGEQADALLHPRRPKLDAAALTQALVELATPLARRAGIEPVPLFLRAAVDPYTLRIRRFSGDTVASQFSDWLEFHGVSVEGPVDIRRLRKSGKVEKALAFRGRVSDIADDHSQQTFRRHYAHGTTLRVIAGNVIATAQRRWLDQALNGPVVLSEEAERSLAEPGAAGALGLSQEEIDQLRDGQLDIGVSSCKDPFDSPFGRTGQLCPVAPTRCLECRNAFVLPSNLPQLLLFADHLATLQLRLSPQAFHALWGQSRINVNEAIKARTDAEITTARRQIAEDGLTLQLPLAAHVEFES
ncbi:hypothetical protein CG747_21555 [Streptomyces sp. CB02959]|uniref:hypothetical protein n=1 Tax=Streptomyces sp. CB02959 TaxID=2020330 RepID=UPI000C26E24A|nr:hypothetical protein [Streptomyces sp. CB02959]PJN38686.1 hypothetical protein CG747_21555 [Streptomyces sp. CB02959]